MEMDDFLENFVEEGKKYEAEHITETISKAFSDSYGHKAYAEVVLIRDKKTNEVDNAAIYCRTAGGIYYPASTYRDAKAYAEGLIKHWENKDFSWEPVKGN